MKVFLVAAFLAVLVVVFAIDSEPPKFYGLIRETESGEVVDLGNPDSSNPSNLDLTCGFNEVAGSIACYGWCVYKGHSEGACKSKVCVCADESKP